MPKRTIDLRELREALEGRVEPSGELPPPPDEPLVPAGADAPAAGITPETGDDPPFLEWRALEFDYDADRAVVLFLLGGLMVLGGIAAAFFRNFLFAAFLVLAGGLLVSYAFRQPRELRFAVTARGVAVGRHRYGFENLRSFWIAGEPPDGRELTLMSRGVLVPRIRIPLGETDPLPLRRILLRFLREEPHEESLTDTVAKRLGL